MSVHPQWPPGYQGVSPVQSSPDAFSMRICANCSCSIAGGKELHSQVGIERPLPLSQSLHISHLQTGCSSSNPDGHFDREKACNLPETDIYQ